MKKFLIRTLLFLGVPVLVLIVLEFALPQTFFSYRIWESITFSTDVLRYSPFYPNRNIRMNNAVGDLGHHTNKAVAKDEYWITDKLGYRNDTFINQADIMFIGDSFIAGSGMMQNDIISNKLRDLMHLKVYNMAPGSFSAFDHYLKRGDFKKPTLVLYAFTVERSFPAPIVYFDTHSWRNRFTNLLEKGDFNVLIDRMSKFAAIRWLNARFQHIKGLGQPSGKNPDMLFMKGAVKNKTTADLDTTVRIILTYKKYCDSLGMQFLFMPMPEKQTVYYELSTSGEQSSYLLQLDSLLNKAGVATINTLKIYNDYRKTNSNLLYHLDDTHWNSSATTLISKEIADKIKVNPQWGLN